MTHGWSVELELAAAGVEVAHAAYVAQLAIAGVKRHRLPKALRIPRPHDPASALRPEVRDDVRVDAVLSMLTRAHHGAAPAVRAVGG